MLQPANRLTLIDSLRPPAGFSLESAMAVTYTLDLRALLAAPAALALAGRSDTDPGGDGFEPVELIHALKSHAGKLTVFGQTGEIRLPVSRRVFAFLERTILPVTAPRGGVVHPKVWVIRYETAHDPHDGQRPERRLRVLISSRNLTFDASWDTVLRLDETTGEAGTTLTPIGGLFQELLELADTGPGEVSADHRQRVASLATALQHARFALPAGVEDLRVHVLGLAPPASPLPAGAERSMIISPFVSDDFFTRVHPGPIGELVSGPEQLDGLKPESLDNVAEVSSFDDGSTPEPAGPPNDGNAPEPPDPPEPPNDGNALHPAGLADDGAGLSPLDPGRPLVGLHAKVFAFEHNDRARLFIGSANATSAAFNRNVEVLAELVGPADVLGIDALCGGTDDEPGLRSLFRPYRPDETADPPPEAAALDQYRRDLARLSITGQVEASDSAWAVTYRSAAPVPVLDDTEIHCWPLAVAGNRRRVNAGEPLCARFETSLENLSGFLAFELAHADDSTTSFVVPVTLVDVPEHRDRVLLRALIGNAERFLRYLLALLDDRGGEAGLLDGIDGVADEPAGSNRHVMSLPVLEKLLQTMRRDPARLTGLHPLLEDLAAEDALPKGFAELWGTIHDAALATGPDQ